MRRFVFWQNFKEEMIVIKKFLYVQVLLSILSAELVFQTFAAKYTYYVNEYQGFLKSDLRIENNKTDVFHMLDASGSKGVWLIGILLILLLILLQMRKDFHGGSKGIYTLMRRPVKKSGYYLSKIIPPAVCLLFFWALQLSAFLRCVHYVRTITPDEMTVATLSDFIESSKLYRFLYPVQPMDRILGTIVFFIAITTIIVFLCYIHQMRGIPFCSIGISIRKTRKEGEKQMLELIDVSKCYHGSGKKAFEYNISFHPGEIVGVFGSNGAGKSTMFKLILGLLKRGHGSILLDGREIKQSDMARISYGSSEHTTFPRLTMKEHVEFYKFNFPLFDEERYRILMGFFELPKFQKLKEFSQGQKNQAEIILALSQGAEYIFLDEPLAGNDMFGREDFYKLIVSILKPNECLVIATHLIEEIKHYLNRAVVLYDSRIAIDMEYNDESEVNLIELIKNIYSREDTKILKLIETLEHNLE